MSDDWLARVEAATSADPWVHGFALVLRSDVFPSGGSRSHVLHSNDAPVGTCGFKGPPADDGIVEIAYGVDPEHQGNGYATEAAEALTSHAFRTGAVRVVRAHTLPEANASTRVLTKCGFRRVGEVIDPEDGLVWRWENTGTPT